MKITKVYKHQKLHAVCLYGKTSIKVEIKLQQMISVCNCNFQLVQSGLQIGTSQILLSLYMEQSMVLEVPGVWVSGETV